MAPAVQSMTATEAVTFDFGADDQTNALLLQDAQTFITGNMARIMAAKHAHDLTANHYQGSWGKWCAAVGISRDTGENMVRVAEQFGNHPAGRQVHSGRTAPETAVCRCQAQHPGGGQASRFYRVTSLLTKSIRSLWPSSKRRKTVPMPPRSPL